MWENQLWKIMNARNQSKKSKEKQHKEELHILFIK